MTDKVHIGSMTFDGEGLSDWIYSALDGWRSSPPMRVTTVDRPNSDGAFGSVKNYRSARTLTFTGGIVGPSEAAARVLTNQFAAVQADGTPFVLSVEDDEDGILSCAVTLSGVAEVREFVSPPGAAVTAQFIAYDPVKYGPSTEYVTGLASAGGGLEYNLFSGGAGGALYYGAVGDLGRVTVTNSGTADVWPVITVTGQMTNGFYVQALETGQVLRYDRIVPAGTFLQLNSRTGEVLVDGISDASAYLTTDSWFSIPAGGSVTIQLNAISGSSGTPTMTVTSSDGYW